jgi:serine/threonine protein kinase
MGEPLSTLANRYDLVEIIGRGGMSVVWRAHDRDLHRQVAVKILSKSIAGDPLFQKRFQREARHVAGMTHPNIVKVYDFGSDGDLPFIVMEYLAGQSLHEILESRGMLPLPMTAGLAGDVLSALEHAHDRGVVHRDIKPGNILISIDGNAKVADFGVAKSVHDTAELTVHGSFVGTATYASPEQLMGRPIGRTSDLYSLGCVLYECLAGRPPFHSDDVERLILQHRFADVLPIQSVRTDVPATMSFGIHVALAKDPADRFASAAEMRAAIAETDGPEDKLSIGLALGGATRQRLAETVATHGTGATLQASGSLLSVGGDAGDSRRHLEGVARMTKRHLGIAAGALVAAFIVVAVLFVWSHNRSRSTSSVMSSTVIPSGGFLQPGESVHTSNRRFTLSMQADGNLVEYDGHRGLPTWQSGTSGNFGAYAVVQADGDFVVYPKGRSAPAPGLPTPALWSSGTYGHPGSYVELPSNGTTLVRARSGSILWRS